jgi:uncharacterized protein with NAD-binding domain and iron-sulfur cluster
MTNPAVPVVISIYGAGIAGLTIAHELVTQGFQVNIYEKDGIVGGMAKSKRDKNNIPSEHSWRGYGPFYYNAFDILKKIPTKQKIETFNNDSTYRYTVEEVAKHNTIDDLWTYYKGDVYNLTEWIPKHPGGRIIIKAGGKDMEQVWKEIGLEWHMKNPRVIKELEKYKIGTLDTKTLETLENVQVVSTVYDNLSKHKISFYLLNDRTFNNIKISLKDYPYLSYIYLKGFLAKNRKQEYFKKLYLPLIKNYVSQDTYDYLVYFGSGPGFGFDINSMSYGHYTYVVERQLQTNQSWQVMSKPTNEAWFDEWVNYLKKLGVKFHLNTILKKINFENNKITSCEIEHQNQIEIVEANEHCICINPYDAIEVFKNSEIKDLYEQHETLKTINKQIGFVIAFKEKIKFPQDNMAFVIVDSPYNITFYPQDYHWYNNIDLGKDVKSLWSGTCIMPFQNNGLSLSIEKFKQEILKQFFNSKHLEKLIKENNKDVTEVFSYKSVVSIQLYDEWYYDTNTQSIESINKKWVNNIVNEELRPDAQTSFTNLYIGGAHCKTSVNIWSMEGAVESGKIVSNLILNKYKKQPTYIYQHKSNAIIETLGILDNMLYAFDLPNILDIILMIVIIWIILRK